MRSIKVTLERDEQLTADFLDLFSKLIVNNTDYIFNLHFENKSQMRYSKFHDYLINSVSLKHNGLKTITKSNEIYNVNFQCKSNNILLMLDLSPYMLIYNFGTKTFPLKNLQEIAVLLMSLLAARSKRDPSYEYRISIYLFSVFKKQYEIILNQELVTEQTFQMLSSFIQITIQNSKMPYEKGLQKFTVSEMMQQAFNSEQYHIGMKSMLIVSSFHEQETTPIILFTPNWYTYGFINMGGHFGSYCVHNAELQTKLMQGTYFKSKYVFNTYFLQNWQMTEIVKKQNPSLTKPVTEKSRSILFQTEGQTFKDILELILVFKIVFRDLKKNKVVGGGESAISNIKDGQNRIIHKNYKIPANSFIYILRTKYIQGWQPVTLTSSLVQNSKFKLRLPIREGCFLYYEATRTKDNFAVMIYQVGQGTKNTTSHSEISNIIERMDRINSYNFMSVLNQNLKIKNVRSRTISWMIQFNQYQIIDYLCYNKQEWGKYFKLKSICFKFQPQMTHLALEEFLNEIGFILGKRVFNSIFIKQNQVERHSDRIDEIENVNRRVMLTKLNFYGHIIEMELAFLRYSFQDITNTLELLGNKMNSRKFKWGIVSLIPNRLITYIKNPQVINYHLFHRLWTIKFKTVHYKNLFKIYWQEVLRNSYEKFTLKNNPSYQKHYYKIIQAKVQHNKSISKIVFLKVKETQDKDNEITFQLAVPPCLVSLLPYYEEYQYKKTISIPELVVLLTNQVKKLQEDIIHLIDTYQTIHFKLLKYSISSYPKLINGHLEQLNSDMYDITFGSKHKWQTYCNDLIQKHYRQGFKETINIVPVPIKFLMSTQLDYIEGDIDLWIDGREYSFFMCTPYKLIYLFRKDKNIYYKVINMYYKDYSVTENEQKFIDLIIKKVIFKVNEQVYCRDFREFLQDNFKGGISKIINNAQFTHLHQRHLDLKLIFSRVDKFYLAAFDIKTVEVQRIIDALCIFTSKLFSILREFFPTLRVNYYFQARNQQDKNHAPFNIDANISRVDSELFMRVCFDSRTDEVDVTQANLPNIILHHYEDVLKEKVFLNLKFYLKAGSNSHKSLYFVEYMISLLNKLCYETAYEIERALITRKDFLIYHIDELTFIWDECKIQGTNLELIREESGEVEVLRNYIQSPVMQHYMAFKTVRQQPTELIILKEDSNLIEIIHPLLMRLLKGRVEFIYHVTQFYSSESKELRIKLQQYLQKLKNFINASILMNQLVQTYQLPLEPEELWMNQRANHKDNKLIIPSKKKAIKNRSVTQKLMKKMSLMKQEGVVPVEAVPQKTVQLVQLHMLYSNSIPLNERIPPGQSLVALKAHQVFQLGQILNLRNTYLLLDDKKNHLIFHFQERDDHAKEQSGQYGKSKKSLFYYVFCLNPLLSREAIDQLILPHIKQALKSRLFDQICDYLLLHNAVIQQFEQYFIRGEKKEFKFEVPIAFDKDQFVNYLTQHIEFYHYRVQFKSAQDKNKSRNTNEQSSSKFLESIRFVEAAKSSFIRDRSTASVMKELSLDKRSLSTEDLNSPGLSPALAASLATRNHHNSQHSYDQFLNKTWLFNCKKPKWNLTERYGKALYFLKLNFRDQTVKSTSRETVHLGKNSYSFADWDELDLNQFKKQAIPKRYSGKLTKRDSTLSRSTILFDIIECVGSPKFNEIEETFSFVVRACLAELYIECFFYEQYKQVIAKYYEVERQEQQSKLKTDMYLWIRKVVWPDLVEWMNEIDSVLQQVNSILFFHYKSEKEILVKDISLYFLAFLNQIVNIISSLYKIEGRISLPIFLFCEFKDQKQEFWMIEDINFQSLSAVLSNDCIKIGFIVTDYLTDIHEKLGCNNFRPPSTPRRSDFLKTSLKSQTCISYSAESPSSKNLTKLDLNLLKYFKDVNLRQDQKFKRSIFMHFQITYEGFRFGSYNLNPAVDLQIKQYLQGLQCWLHQKMKIFLLIKNIKESNNYQTLVCNKSEDRKMHFFYEMRYVHQINSEDKARSLPTMYRLLVNLVFKEFPEKINCNETTSQQEKDKKLGKQIKNGSQQPTRYRLIHHCKQVSELLEILMSSPVDYSQYQSYKGNQKFLLEKWGREYISLLRQNYIEK